jgi:hypothetical protein
VDTITLTPPSVTTRLPGDDARITELEHLLRLERARREAIEEGLDRLSARCAELARENALLRERLGEPTPA